MTIAPSDRIYFVDPLPLPTTKLPDNAKILITQQAYRRNTGAQVGDIVRVTGTTYGSYDQFWYIGEDGNHYDGHIINSPTLRRHSTVMEFIGDDAFLGSMLMRFPEQNTYMLGSARRWSRTRTMADSVPVRDFCATTLVRPAQWAADLWPDDTDSDAMVEAKVALAKFKWETRQKHLAIMREGQQREWLHHLERKNFFSDQGMPRPVYGAVIGAFASVPTLSDVQHDQLPPHAQQHVERLTNSGFRVDQRTSFPSRVEVPVKFIYEGSEPYAEGRSIHNVPDNLVTSQFQNLTNNYDVTIRTDYVQPIITSVR